MGGGDGVLAHESAGCPELLPGLPISHSADSTSLSLHPVHDFYLEVKVKPPTGPSVRHASLLICDLRGNNHTFHVL